MAAAGSILGNAVQRLEDPTLLTGAGKYLDDMLLLVVVHILQNQTRFIYNKDAANARQEVCAKEVVRSEDILVQIPLLFHGLLKLAI